LPHLQFSRDKRGYESTYIVHLTRRRGKAGQRILYWFRSPPNVRVGRAALDEAAIRALEEHNPDIEFDWTKILESQPPPPRPDPGERRRTARRAAGAGNEPKRRRAARTPAASRSSPRAVEEPSPASVGVAEVLEGAEGPPVSPPRVTARPVSEPQTAALASVDEAPPAGLVSQVLPFGEDSESEASDQSPALVPVTVYHGGADVQVRGAPDDAPRVSLVKAKLGSEQLARVRARYAEIMARITERAADDPARLDELRRAADTLNPDGWVTDAEIVSALQHFDTRLGELRRSLGIKRRRRSRRGGRRRRGRGAGDGAGTGPAETGLEASNQGEAASDSDDAGAEDPGSGADGAGDGGADDWEDTSE